MAQVNITTELSKGVAASSVSLGTDDGRVQSISLKGKTVKDSAAIKTLQSYLPQISSGLMPPGVRWVSANRRTILFEQPPRYITFNYTDTAKDNLDTEAERKKFTTQLLQIPLPWMGYIVSVDANAAPVEQMAFILGGSIQSLADPVFAVPLPNFFPDGRLCKAPQDEQETGFGTSIEGAVAATFYSIWMTGFNTDLHTTMAHARQNKTPAFLLKDMTKGNISSMLNIWSKQSFKTVVESKWPKHKYSTVSDVINSDMFSSAVSAQYVNWFVTRVAAAYQNNL